MIKKTVSCIIPALNESKNIESLILSIKKQENIFSTIVDIIVVDNGSDDDTVSIARSIGANVFICPKVSIGELRNIGALNCSGDLLVFIDADNVLEINTIDRFCANFVNDDEIGAINVVLSPSENPTWIEDAWFYHLRSKHEDQLSNSSFLSSGAFAIKKDYFFEIGGFDNKLIVGEDTELSKRIKRTNKKILTDLSICIYNSGYPKTTFQFFKRELWHGDSLSAIYNYKIFDHLTIYLILFVITFFTSFSLYLYKGNFIFLCFLFSFIFIPSLVKSWLNTRRFSKQFFQLILVYSIYILARSASLFLLKKNYNHR